MIAENQEALEKCCLRLSNLGRSSSSIQLYTRHLTDFLEFIGEKKFNDVVNDDIHKFIQSKREKEKEREERGLSGQGIGRISTVGEGNLKASYMNSIYSSLRTFYKTLELYELSAKIELAKMPPWSPSTVEQQEVMKLFSRDSIVRAYLADKKKQKKLPK